MTTISEQPAVQAAGEAFHEVVRCLKDLHAPEWSEVDLTMAQLKALGRVAMSGGLSGRELAQRLGVGPSAVTGLVDKLVQHRYVRREEDADDRRITWIRPTAEGLALLDRVNSGWREQVEEILATLSPEELNLVNHALEVLRHAAERRVAAVRVQKGTHACL